NAANVCGVVAVGELLGLPHEAVAAGVAAVRGVPGRLEPVEAGEAVPGPGGYAPTPAPPRKLPPPPPPAPRRRPGGGGVAPGGGGGEREGGKGREMGAIAGRLADVAVVTSDNPRTEEPEAIIAEILEGARAEAGGAEVAVEEDRREAIALAMARAGRG